MVMVKKIDLREGEERVLLVMHQHVPARDHGFTEKEIWGHLGEDHPFICIVTGVERVLEKLGRLGLVRWKLLGMVSCYSLLPMGKQVAEQVLSEHLSAHAENLVTAVA